MRRFSVRFLLCLFLCTPSLSGQSAAPVPDRSATGIRGTVFDAEGAAVAGAIVRVSGTTRQTVTDAEGVFRFETLPPGRYVLEATSSRAGRAVVSVELPAGGDREVELRLDVDVHGETITVTASPDPRAADEIAVPVAVIDAIELLAIREPSLGETLANQPGVSSSYFGPGASRPIIRGLGGDRIRILDNGLGAGDASSTSPDHAVAADPLAAERIEIVRGPATLLYGSNAVGGVVNVLDGSIPDVLPESPISGSLTLSGGTAADERAGAISLSGALGRLAWSISAGGRESDDVEIPGFAESQARRDAEEEEEHEGEAQESEEHEEETEAFGTLPDSASEGESLRAGLSWVTEHGFFGLSVSGYDTLYGVPGHAHEHEHEEGEEGQEEGVEEHAEEGVRIDLEQRRVDVRGELARELGPLRGLKLRAGSYDYEHAELEGDAVGTRFRTDGWELRFEAPHRQFGAVSGTWGLQMNQRAFEAIGEEAFVPANDSEGIALFAFEEIHSGTVAWQLGARYESHDVSVADPGLPARSFSGVSGSAGFSWSPSESWRTSLALSRSVTVPNPEALYSDGAHLATRVYEIGDPSLDEEVSLGADLSLHFESEWLHLIVSGYFNRVDDFVAESFTGEEIDDLPVVRFGAVDAELYGAELEAHVPLLHAEPHHLELDLRYDFVRGEERGSGTPLPRIPPSRYGAGFSYRGEQWSAGIAGTRVTEADRLAPFETSTAAYTLLDASVGYRFFLGGTVHDLVLSGKNLTDEEARVHSSTLKDLAPLPGRDVRLSYRLAF
jgi:iron complex outermembrane receptor protein